MSRYGFTEFLMDFESLSDYDKGWLVGWLEGEGTFHCSILKAVGNRKEHRRLTIIAVSTDFDVVLRAATLGGKVYGPFKRSNPAHKDWYQWNYLGSQVEKAKLMRALRPYLSTRRQAQIDAALTKAKV